MNLLVVLPFFYGDEHLLLKNLAWMQELDGKLDYDCLLSCDKKTNPAKAQAAAAKLFRSVKLLQYQRATIEKWPFLQNNAFTNAAWYVFGKHEGPWFWQETDSVPLRKGWLDSLWTEYRKGGKPFGGHLNKVTNVFNGVAFYPQNISRYSQKVMTAALLEGKDAKGQPYQPPWDVHASSEVCRHLHVMNGLMQHTWQNNDTGQAWTFPDQVAVKKGVREGVVIFHRNKDLSLIDRMREARCKT